MENVKSMSQSIGQDNNPQQQTLAFSNQRKTREEIKFWLVSYLANLLEIKADEVDTTIPFDRYGLDSVVAVGLTGDLEDWMGCAIDPTILYDYPTIDSLVNYLSEN